MGIGCETTGKSPTFSERLRSVLFGKIPEWTLSPEGKDMGFRKRASAIRSELIERIKAVGIVKSDKIIAELGIQKESSALAIGLVHTASKRLIRPFVDETKPVCHCRKYWI